MLAQISSTGRKVIQNKVERRTSQNLYNGLGTAAIYLRRRVSRTK